MANASDPQLDEGTAAQLAEMFRALADPSRLRLLSALSERELCVHELVDVLCMEQSAVSHQLRLLRDRDLVTRRREGRHMYYSLSDSHVKALYDFGVEHVRHSSRGKAR